jgi:glycosyltransferase involved in cell wall biosynthesis
LILRSVHVIAGLAAHNGGPSYSVPRLRRALVAGGCAVELMTVKEAAGGPSDIAATAFKHSLGSMPVLAELRLSRDLKRALKATAPSVDIIHNHGLWLMPNVYAGRAAARAGLPLVVSPRGMLAPEALRFSANKKRIFWRFFQEPALVKAAAWHATSQEEAEDIRAMGIKASVGVIPNGIDVPCETAQHAGAAQQRTVLFLSRLHPKKSLPNLIEAWSSVSTQRPAWHLIIAGPDEGGHRAELEAQARARGVQHISFMGPIYGPEKDNMLASADLLVLPTKNENFGLAVAEALAAGVPAIVTKGAPWAGLETERCGWWIDHGIEPLKASLLEATALPPTVRQEMGLRGRAWMARDFSWDAIAQQMMSLYSWVCGRGDRPTFVC